MDGSNSSTAIYVVVREDGTILGQTAAAEEVSLTPELTNLVEQALAARSERRRRTKIEGVGTVHITTLHGEGSAKFLVSIEKECDTLEPLTVRQREVSWLAAAGLSVDEIAWELDISSNTVKYHLKEAYRRLGVTSRVELAAIASGTALPKIE